MRAPPGDPGGRALSPPLLPAGHLVSPPGASARRDSKGKHSLTPLGQSLQLVVGSSVQPDGRGRGLVAQQRGSCGLQEAYLQVTPGAAAAARPQAPTCRLPGPGPLVPRSAAPSSRSATGLSLGASSRAGEGTNPAGRRATGPQALAHLPLGLPLGDLAPFCSQWQLPPRSRDGSSELP